TFAFRAVDPAGATSAGELQADSKVQVTEQLRQRGLIVLDVSQKSEQVNVEDFLRRFKGISMRDLAVMSRQMATLVASGMAMLRSGEQSGRLEEALDRVAFHLEKIDALRRQVRSALLYPAFVFLVALMAMVGVVAFVVPVFVGIFNQINAENPAESAALPLP